MIDYQANTTTEVIDFNFSQIKVNSVEVAVKYLGPQAARFVAIDIGGHVMHMPLHDFMIMCRTYATFR